MPTAVEMTQTLAKVGCAQSGLIDLSNLYSAFCLLPSAFCLLPSAFCLFLQSYLQLVQNLSLNHVLFSYSHLTLKDEFDWVSVAIAPSLSVA
jgi:hypothetical protein